MLSVGIDWAEDHHELVLMPRMERCWQTRESVMASRVLVGCTR